MSGDGNGRDRNGLPPDEPPLLKRWWVELIVLPAILVAGVVLYLTLGAHQTFSRALRVGLSAGVVGVLVAWFRRRAAGGAARVSRRP